MRPDLGTNVGQGAHHAHHRPLPNAEYDRNGAKAPEKMFDPTFIHSALPAEDSLSESAAPDLHIKVVASISSCFSLS